MEKLFLVDAYAMIFRNYYAFLGRPMRNAQGLNTSAIFGFTKFLRDLIKKERPRYLGVAFDPKGGNFRHELYTEYKANRQETPEDITASVPYIKRILQAMRIPILEVPGYEADDVIGTLSAKACEAGFEVYMVTPDKDFGQLIRPSVFIYKQTKTGTGIERIGPEQIREHYGIDDPRLVIDILALWGDASDNIPGVPGIGEKSAVKLVCEYGTVENILANSDRLKGKQRENILASQEQLMLSKKLATIDMDAPICFVPEELMMEDPDCEALRTVYRELGFNMFIREMETDCHSPFAHAPTAFGLNTAGAQADLFGTSGSAQAKVETSLARSTPATGMDASGIQHDLFGAVVNDAQAERAEKSLRSAEESGYATVHTTPHDYLTVTTEEELRSLVSRLEQAEAFCFDTETTGFDIYNDRLVGISFSIEPHRAYYVPFDRDNTARWLEVLRPAFENPDIAKIGQNLKFDVMVLRALGISVKGFKYDTMILDYLLDAESRHGMDYLARTLLGYAPIEIETLIGRGAKQLTMDRVPLDIAAEYGAEDADVTLRLKEVLWPRIVEQGLAELYRTIEEPLIDTLVEIEMTGVKIDTDILAEYSRRLQDELAGIEGRIRAIAQWPELNINSARQLGELLFDRLKIEAKPKLTRTKQYCTDEEYLQSLSDRHEVIGLVLEYRGIKKLLSTYADALPLLINPKTGRIHTSFNQAVTATGRLSSTNPNLQNIPVRDERGRHIRRAFVPSDDDHVLLAADYSQVELRLMAHLSGDPALIEAFRNGEDIHAATAARLFGIPLEEVSADQRRKAKTANFGIIYGISAFGLKQRIADISLQEARSIIDGYFKSYPQVREYIERVIGQAQENGYVETIFGRRRYLADIRSHNANARGLAERNAVNAPIQGSAADIMKIAMNTVHRELTARGLRSRVILQVHDELVVDTVREEQAEVTELVRRAMEDAAQLTVALTVDCGTGHNWLEAH